MLPHFSHTRLWINGWWPSLQHCAARQWDVVLHCARAARLSFQLDQQWEIPHECSVCAKFWTKECHLDWVIGFCDREWPAVVQLYQAYIWCYEQEHFHWRWSHSRCQRFTQTSARKWWTAYLHVQFQEAPWFSTCECRSGRCGTTVHSQIYTKAPWNVLAKYGKS